VTGIGERPLDALDPELRGWLDGYEQVPSVCHQDSMLDAVRRCQKREWVDRLETTIESHVLPVAHVRVSCGIPGTSVETAFLCRDKPAMKEALRKAGVPCAQSTGANTPAEVHAFVERVGFPVIVKPRSSAGAEGTYRVDDAAGLGRVITECAVDRGSPVALEEFIEGHEGFYDTLCAGGEVVHEFITHYYPNVLEGMRDRWVAPQFVATNRLDSPGYQQVRELGHKVIGSLGIETSATHMEWFFGPRGLNFSEIGCRPPGVDAWDVYCAANEMDVYLEWARTILGQPPAQQPSRRYAAGHVALRPDRDGRIAGYEGVEELRQRYGEWLVATHFPGEGTPTQPIEAGYKANAWVRLRHTDYDTLRRMLDDVSGLVRVHAR
jgi:hypothetical protein